MKMTIPALVTISAINGSGWDADLLVPAGKKVEITDLTCLGSQLAGTIMAYGGLQ